MPGRGAITGAERSRVFRARRKAGARVVLLELAADQVEGLVRCGLLAPDRRGDIAAIGAAVHQLIDDASQA